MFNQNQNIMKKLFTLFAAMVTFVALNAQTVDYELLGYVANTQSQDFITEINLSLTDDLNPVVLLYNNGPDVPNANDTIFFDISIEGNMIGSMMGIGSNMAQLTAGNAMYISGQSPLFTAADMEGMEGSFQFCYTVRIGGAAVDPVSSNNQACITINRGTVGINELTEGEVNVYPNPATTVINIDNAEGAQVSVFDINGRMISNIESASANQTIDASSFAKGMYIVRIANGNNVITKKVSVVR